MYTKRSDEQGPGSRRSFDLVKSANAERHLSNEVRCTNDACVLCFCKASPETRISSSLKCLGAIAVTLCN